MGKHGRGDCGRRGRFSSSPGNWYFSGGAFVMFRAARKAENDERRRIWNLVACASPVNWSRWRETRSCHRDERQKFGSTQWRVLPENRNVTERMKIRIQRTQVFAIRSILNRSRDTNFTIIKSLGLKRERIARTNRRFLQWGGGGGSSKSWEQNTRYSQSAGKTHKKKKFERSNGDLFEAGSNG